MDLQIDKHISAIKEIVLKYINEANKIYDLSQQDKKILEQYRYKIEKYEAKIRALYSSKSWRYTRIFRIFTKKMSADEFFNKIEMQLNNSNDHESLEVNINKNKYKFDRKNIQNKFNNSIHIAIASIPSREQSLKKTIDSLIKQADIIHVFLNNYNEIPKFLCRDKIEVVRSQDYCDKGDAGKFFWANKIDGFYLTCDDDIIYPDYYVENLIDKIKEHGMYCVCGWHGSLINDSFNNYYDTKSRKIFSYEKQRPWDTAVHILGTGCLGFHTNVLKISFDDFKIPNMADIFFAKIAQEKKIPLYVIAHKANQLITINNTQENSINFCSKNNIVSKKNTKIEQTNIVKNINWNTHEWNSLKILLIGRFSAYNKGGIFKSCKLLTKTLQDKGHIVVCKDTEDNIIDIDHDFDISIIYPGDPTRPDFKTIEDKIYFLKSYKIPIIVNLSYNLEINRSKWIKNEIIKFNTEGSPVFLMTFSHTSVEDYYLKDIKKYIITLPKTIDIDRNKNLSFFEREGICFGDGTKLSNQNITGENTAKWIDAVRKRLPHVNFYAFKQYSGENKFKTIKYVPYNNKNFGEWLGKRRLFVCLNKFVTFEMVGCEAQINGTPVIYKSTPQSLSEYIGVSGIRVDTPTELGEVCAFLYNNPGVWNEFNIQSINNGNRLDIKYCTASIETNIRLAILKAKYL